MHFYGHLCTYGYYCFLVKEAFMNISFITRYFDDQIIKTDLVNAMPDNSSVNTVQHARIEEDMFSIDPTDAPIDWLDSDHVYVYCRLMSVPWL
jgi:hypothetical protein